MKYAFYFAVNDIFCHSPQNKTVFLGSGKQIFEGDYAYKITEIIIIRQSVSSYQCAMYDAFSADKVLQLDGSAHQFFVKRLVNGKIVAIKLHLAHIDDVVLPQNQEVNLRPILFVVAGNSND